MLRPEFDFQIVRRQQAMLLREAARERLARQVTSSDQPRVPDSRLVFLLALVAGLAGYAAVMAR